MSGRRSSRLEAAGHRNCASRRNADVIPLRVGLAPKRRSPGSVQSIQRSVPPLEPDTERSRATLAVAAAAELVVDLPTDDALVAPVPLADRADDPPRLGVIHGIVRAVMASVSKRVRLSARTDRKDVRVL